MLFMNDIRLIAGTYPSSWQTSLNKQAGKQLWPRAIFIFPERVNEAAGYFRKYRTKRIFVFALILMLAGLRRYLPKLSLAATQR
jgi:hypothetical protein